MERIRLGILSPSEIAFRRFMPAIMTMKNFEYVGIGIASLNEYVRDEGHSGNDWNARYTHSHVKAERFRKTYGGVIYKSYDDLVRDEGIDAVYIPLPPALHFQWSQRALKCGKHILVEKPITIKREDTESLIQLASDNKLVIHENYMFIFHQQMDFIRNILDQNIIGEIRHMRIYFGFPHRAAEDFRYKKVLGGGALWDCGGYTIKCVQYFLGKNIRMEYGILNYKNCESVDIGGSGAYSNDKGVVAQIAFGMDNEYKCELEIWGAMGTIYTDRILTAPAGFIPKIVVRKRGEETIFEVPADDTFKKSLDFFNICMTNGVERTKSYDVIKKQSELVNEFYERSTKI